MDLRDSADSPQRARLRWGIPRRGGLWWGLACRALVAVLIGLLGGVARAQDADGLRLEGPARVPGDGITTFELVVRNAPGGAAVANADVGLDAGRLVARRELDEGRAVLELMPPRVVEPTAMTVTLRIHGFGKAEYRVEVSPALGDSGRYVSTGALGLDVPARLILGLDAEADIRFRTPGHGGVRLYASEGSLAPPTVDSNSVSVAKYTPPQTKFPSLAIIVAASLDGKVLDWAPIRLFGWPAVATRSERNAAVTVKVDGETFGPIRADPRGRGTMRVLVPPGVTQARVLARDAVGNESNVPLDLGTPTSWPLMTLCPAESERVYVFALDEMGRPRSDATLAVASSLGALSAPRRVGGYFAYGLTLPPSAEMGALITYSAQVEGEPGSRASCESRVVGEAPTRMSLAAEPGRWRAGIAAPVKIRAQLEFAGYRTPRVVPVLPRVDIGEITAVNALSPQLYELTWRLPNQLDGRAQAHIVVQTDSASPVLAGLELPLSSAAPERIEVRLGAGRLVADGVSTTTVEVRVVDRYGNLDRTAPLVTTSTGSVSPFRRGTGGVLVATYRTPRSSYLSSDTVRVRLRDGPLTARTVVALEPVGGGLRVFGRAGFTMPLGKLAGPAASAGAAYRLPALDGGMFVTSQLGFSYSRDTRRDSLDVEDVTVQSTVLPLGVGLHYDLQWSAVSPYVELGPKLALARLSQQSDSAGKLDGWTTAFGGWLGCGVLVPVGHGSVTLDSEYSYLPVDWVGISGNLGGLFFGAGYAVEL